ncbi:hypothetical protein AsAng_0036260 [Aureispira anguillae]|uniref:Uncharacterized protein n=1 Tax=Aureispira anguillae TaxID=2864201 RepID=A0A915YH60_9BACT|nr:hypothetical protein AsAng_0036260 [Aureispira anguillae]
MTVRGRYWINCFFEDVAIDYVYSYEFYMLHQNQKAAKP